ncbi:MAG: universal stress protein [Anaerolineales bacterium]
MSGVVCAIRGGPSSEATIQRAIRLAKDEAMPLHLLYVVNLDFLTHTESSRTRLVSDELEQMGDFILLSAQSKAEAQGIEANGTVRQGNVGEQIVELAREVEADYVVMGKPEGQGQENVFTGERIQAFSSQIEQESGARVVLVEAVDS